MIMYRVGAVVERGLEWFRYYKSKKDALAAVMRAIDAGDRKIVLLVIDTDKEVVKDA